MNLPIKLNHSMPQYDKWKTFIVDAYGLYVKIEIDMSSLRLTSKEISDIFIHF